MQILMGFIRTKMTTKIVLFPMSMKNKSAKKALVDISHFQVYFTILRYQIIGLFGPHPPILLA